MNGTDILKNLEISNCNFDIVGNSCWRNRGNYFTISNPRELASKSEINIAAYYKLLTHENECTMKRVSQGFWGTREHWQNIEGNKGTLANFW